MLRVIVALLLLMLMTAGPALAEGGGKHEVGSLVRMVVMMPLLHPGGDQIIRIVPITLDLTTDTQESKDALTNIMPKLQDAYLAGAYGKIYTNWGYDKIQGLLKDITDKTVGDEFKDQVHLSIRVNVKPQ